MGRGNELRHPNMREFGIYVDGRLVETHKANYKTEIPGRIYWNSWLHGTKYKIKRVGEQ